MTALLDRVQGSWAIVPGQATVAFAGRASRFSPEVKARFGRVDGDLVVDRHGGEVDVRVDLTSLTTGTAAWDELLTALDPFDVAHHPTGRYRSARVHLDGEQADVDGALELAGRRSPVRLTGSHRVLDATRARLTASGTVDRRAFGLRLDVPGCRFLLPAQLRVSVDVVVARAAQG